MVRILLESMDLPDLVWNLETYNYYGKLKSMSHNFPTRDLKFFKSTYVCAIIVDKFLWKTVFNLRNFYSSIN